MDRNTKALNNKGSFVFKNQETINEIMSNKEDLSGRNRRNGRLPAYDVVSTQDNDFNYSGSYNEVEGNNNNNVSALPATGFDGSDYIDHRLADTPSKMREPPRHLGQTDYDYQLQYDCYQSDEKKPEPAINQRRHENGDNYCNVTQSENKSFNFDSNDCNKNRISPENRQRTKYAGRLGFSPETTPLLMINTSVNSKMSPSAPLVEPSATRNPDITHPDNPQPEDKQSISSLGTASYIRPNKCNTLPIQVHGLTERNRQVGLEDRENNLARAGFQENIASDVCDRNNSLQESAEATISHPRSNISLAHSKVNRATRPEPFVVKETFPLHTPGVAQASHGNGRGDNYSLKQGDNSRLVASLDESGTTSEKVPLSASCFPDNPIQIKSMGDPVLLESNGQKTNVLAELETNGSDFHANSISKSSTNPKKTNDISGAICNNKVANGAVVDNVYNDDTGSGPCGWGRFRFDFCEKFRSSKWFLVVLTLCGACQGMAVNGFVNTVISTVERRYEISSTESGLIASCYDIMFVLLVIPISYFGGQGHKPRYLGIGIFILGVGSFVFALPHFISGNYYVENADETVCRPGHNISDTCSIHQSTSLSNYKYFFYLGQLLHGAGATPLYTLGVTFMDENVPQRSSSFYNGIFYTGAIIGPAIGYMVGAKFLDLYTDILVDPTSLGLDPNNPKWVGAWWIGFLISGTIGVLLSLPLLAFPAALPGSSKFALERGHETQASKHVDQTGQHRGFKDILLSLKYLLTNIPFMFINIAAAADGILVAGFSTFMPKFIEYEFGLPAGTAALYVGLAVVPAGGGATFGGGFIVKCFNLKMRGILRLCTVMSFILCALAVALLMECGTMPFAGVTLPYGQTNVNDATFLGKNLDNACNQNCACAEEDFYPVCGRDKVLYFSPCYAGCKDVSRGGTGKRYANCSCINYNVTSSDYSDGNSHQAEFGKCEFSCKWLTLFLLLFGAMIIFVFITSMPSLTATLRSDMLYIYLYLKPFYMYYFITFRPQ